LTTRLEEFPISRASWDVRFDVESAGDLGVHFGLKARFENGSGMALREAIS